MWGTRALDAAAAALRGGSTTPKMVRVLLDIFKQASVMGSVMGRRGREEGEKNVPR